MEIEYNIEDRISAVLGKSVLVTTECGLGVFCRDSMVSLLSIGKPPKTLTANWIAKKISQKEVASARLVEARKDAEAKIRAYLAQKGVDGSTVSLYCTSFGFSVENLFRNGMEEAKRVISDAGIEFKRIEYSDAHWVVRVII